MGEGKHRAQRGNAAERFWRWLTSPAEPAAWWHETVRRFDELDEKQRERATREG